MFLKCTNYVDTCINKYNWLPRSQSSFRCFFPFLGSVRVIKLENSKASLVGFCRIQWETRFKFSWPNLWWLLMILLETPKFWCHFLGFLMRRLVILENGILLLDLMYIVSADGWILIFVQSLLIRKISKKFKKKLRGSDTSTRNVNF